MHLNEDQLDALTEIVNIGVGRGAASLHSLVDKPIDLRVPNVRLCSLTELNTELGLGDEPVDTSVVQGFDGAIAGRALLAFPRKSGVALAKLVAEDETEQNELEFDLAEILEEIGNIVLNGVLGSLANVLTDDFRYSVPELYMGSASQALARDVSAPEIGSESMCLLADTRFGLSDSQITGSLLLAFNSGNLSNLLDRLLDSVGA